MPEQLQFPFASLDFPGRSTLTIAEIAEKLGWTEKHVSDLVAEGELNALDGRGRDATRSSYRVPIESYRDFVVTRMTGARRGELLRHLPKATLRELVRELSDYIRAA